MNTYDARSHEAGHSEPADLTRGNTSVVIAWLSVGGSSRSEAELVVEWASLAGVPSVVARTFLSGGMIAEEDARRLVITAAAMRSYIEGRYVRPDHHTNSGPHGERLLSVPRDL